jgi:hypothetical protein
MQNQQIDEFYPSITYQPSDKWCAFNFYVFAKFFEHDEGYIHPADGKYTLEEMMKYQELKVKNEKNIANKFPTAELMKKHTQETNIKKFTGIKNDVRFMPRDDPIGMLIYTNIPIYAPQLDISIEKTFLQAGMHNGGSANIGLLLTAYGLRALNTIYNAYDVQFHHLPVLDFQKEYLKATIPIIHLNNRKDYDFKTGKITPDINEDSVEFTVPYSIGNEKVRCETSFFLLEKITFQAKKNLYLCTTQKEANQECPVINFAERSEKMIEERKN